MIIEGGCYCGAVRYRAEGEPLSRGMCHCRECQYITGGGANVVMGMPADKFVYTQGAPQGFSRSDLDTPALREFCANCGTHLVTRSPRAPTLVLIKVGTLDEPAIYGLPTVAVYASEMQSFHRIPEGVRSFEKRPG